MLAITPGTRRWPAQAAIWFLDASGAPLAGAYYAYVERTSPVPGAQATRILFDTDIMGDVDYGLPFQSDVHSDAGAADDGP
jgi:hypothetical protein